MGQREKTSRGLMIREFTDGKEADVKPLRELRGKMLFFGLWMFIIGVSVHDGYLVLTSRTVIDETEQNPVGQWLLRINRGDIWLLLLVKAAGTILVGTLLLLLRTIRPRLALAITPSVAIFQLWLLCWLYQP